MEAVTVREIEAAAETIDGVARRTPALEAGEISRRVGAPVTLKAECLQATGSFKVRGAFNAIAELGEAELQSGVVTASAGNHAQAVVAAAKRAGARADLFMPAAAPLAKVAAVRRRGGEVHLVEGSYDEAAEAAREFAGKHGATFVPAFDHPAIIAGQGTIGLEIAEQAPETTLVLVPVGGGALVAGIAIAIKARLEGCRVVGVQAENCAPYLESLAARRPIGARSAGTICDGIAVKRPGDLTLPLVDEWVDEIVTVTDDEAAEAMVLLLERSKLVVEGAGAVGVAALLSGKVEAPGVGRGLRRALGGKRRRDPPVRVHRARRDRGRPAGCGLGGDAGPARRALGTPGRRRRAGGERDRRRTPARGARSPRRRNGDHPRPTDEGPRPLRRAPSGDRVRGLREPDSAGLRFVAGR